VKTVEGRRAAWGSTSSDGNGYYDEVAPALSAGRKGGGNAAAREKIPGSTGKVNRRQSTLSTKRWTF